MLRITLTTVGLLCTVLSFTQITFTAQHEVKPYRGGFRTGVNLGWYNDDWTDEKLAALAIGDPAMKLSGAGITSLRLTLPGYFLEYYDYDIRKEAFEYYAHLGSEENVLFIGHPGEEMGDRTQYCPGEPSRGFKNMYEPIWDDGANGTPVNDENAYALYVYKLLMIYDDQVRFWEVMNEPDLDYSGNGWKGPEFEGNWFDNVPDPCDYKMAAPIQHYVRMLRITYEVVKTFSPDDYVAVGGLGSPGFLDLILRHTDNPDGGRPTSAYPHYGGAWFDAMSYHVYPHIDGQMREWSNEAGGFVYERNSDRAVDRLLSKKEDFANVLDVYGYDGKIYPEKVWLITETNVPRKAFTYHGSQAFQRNFFIKSAIMAQTEDITQIHWYQLGDKTKEEWAGSEFDLMGLYGSLKYHGMEDAPAHEAAIGGRNLTELTRGYHYDADLTRELQLPDEVRGAAFLNQQREPLFVLWAVANRDKSEEATYQYQFPSRVLDGQVEIKPWDFTLSGSSNLAEAASVPLTGDPVFITSAATVTTPANDPRAPELAFSMYPNPSKGSFRVDFPNPLSDDAQIQLLDAYGREVHREHLEAGGRRLRVQAPELAGGLYLVKVEQNDGKSWTGKLLISE